MGSRVLVAYATKHGSTREIAEEIGRVLEAAGLETVVMPARGVVDLAPYDAIVLGSALYAAHWRREANRFVTRHLEELRHRPVWLFSSGPLDRSADAGILPATPTVAVTAELIGAQGHCTFGGRLLADTPGLDPQVLLTHPVGDFRNWPAIRDWAATIASTLGTPS
jgi:menaquinone-dependent protoporphyrinogen oxidase